MEAEYNKQDLFLKVKGSLLSIFLTLLSFFGSQLIIGNFESKSMPERFLIFLGLFLLVVLLEYVVLYIYDLFLDLKNRGNIKDKGIIFPEGITSKDIFPYVVEHVEINYKLIYNDTTGMIDLETIERYTTSGGAIPIERFDHTFLLSEEEKQNLKIEVNGLSPSDIIADSYFIDKKVTSILNYNSVYRVNLAIPLDSNSQYKYEIKFFQPNWTKPFSIPGENDKIEYFEVTPIIEMKNITITIEFPEEIKIIRPKICVIGKSDSSLDKVEKYLIDRNLDFKENLVSLKKRGKLQIDTPIPDVRYRVSWIWPMKKI